MDAAKMIEEKRLRQGFMLATLISTIAGTFITSINLYDRLVEQRRQKKLDRGQNKKIKELEQRLNEEQDEKRRIKEAHRKKHDDSDDDDSDTSNSSSNNNKKKKRRNNGRNNGLRNSLEQSGNIVQQTYDRYLANLGPRFAQGDLIAQTQVQSQIILLQGSVIKLLEEALLTGTMPDINRLYNTSEFAREGSMRALRDQYQRMLEAATPQPGRRPPGLVRKISSTPSLRERPDDSAWRQRRPEPKALMYDKRSDRLFCPCAEELQRTNRPLDSCIVMDRSAALCEACGAEVDAGNDAGGPGGWRIEKEVVLRGGSSVARGRRWSSRESDDGSETTVLRSYLVTRRFIFKCHREGSEFACYLCCCYRDRDTLCRSEESLVSHIASKHGIADYERERDIREQERALPYR